MVAAIFILACASLLGSGILFTHRRMLTLLAAAGALFEGQWLLLTFLDRAVLTSTPSNSVFLAGAIILAALWASQNKQWSWPYGSSTGSGTRDLFILPVLLLVLAAAWLVSSRNGFENNEWLVHGFYNGDTATLQALTQRSILTDGLVDTNPFSGGGYLEYPTLLHGGLATFLGSFSDDQNWFRFLPALTYAQIIITIPLFFLLWDLVFPEPNNDAEKWFGVPSRIWIYVAQAAIALYVIALSWDNYIYPQGHFFLTGMFLLLAGLLVTAYRMAGRQQISQAMTAGLIAIILMLSNAVTGTAAIAIAAGFALLRANDAKRSPRERGIYLASVAVLAVLFFSATPGDGSFGLPGFSYTSAIDMVRLAGPMALLFAGVFLTLGTRPVLSTSTAILSLLAVVTFFFSTRNIVIENASRFFYHALLIGFPLMLPPVIQLFYFLRRELLYTTRTLIQRTGGWGIAVTAALLLALPAGASVASAHDNLMFKDEQRIPTAMVSALWWIQDSVPPDAVFIAAPDAPFAVPLFTGRALLRADYWLSPDDVTLADVTAAFAGDTAAREHILPQADYLLLTAEQREAWEPLPESLPKVFDNGGVVIYQLR